MARPRVHWSAFDRAALGMVVASAWALVEGDLGCRVRAFVESGNVGLTADKGAFDRGG